MPSSRLIHKDHLLSIDAIRLDSGVYKAQVAVICLKGDRTRSQRFIDLKETFPCELAAKERGHAVGIDWVEINGDKPDSGFHTSRVFR